MGIEKTFFMDCDRCGNVLTDSDGPRTAGREVWLVEHADMCGWEYDSGWYCAVCVAQKAENAPAQAGKGEL